MGPGFSEYPNHKIETIPMKGVVEVFMDGEQVAVSKEAIKLIEDGYPPRFYIPLRDVKNIELLKSKENYHCPFKGAAEFYTVKHGANRYAKAAWAYSQPYDEFTMLKNYIAFYPQKVQLIRVKVKLVRN